MQRPTITQSNILIYSTVLESQTTNECVTKVDPLNPRSANSTTHTPLLQSQKADKMLRLAGSRAVRGALSLLLVSCSCDRQRTQGASRALSLTRSKLVCSCSALRRILLLAPTQP